MLLFYICVIKEEDLVVLLVLVVEVVDVVGVV